MLQTSCPLMISAFHRRAGMMYREVPDQQVGVSKNRGLPYFGVLIIRILLFRVLY